MDMTGALDYLNSLTEKFIKEGGGPGVCVGVVSDKKIYMEKAYGISNIEKKEKMCKKTIYLLASVSKTISGTMVCYLQKKYNVNLLQKNAGVIANNNYLSNNIKIVDLLSHRSGIPEQYGSYKELVGYNIEKIMGGVKYIENINFRNEKNYTNIPFTYGCKKACEYLNLSVDKAYSMLFNKIGMENTSLDYKPDKYIGYFQLDNKYIPYTKVNYEEQVSAGGIYSNIIDMNKFLMFHLKNEIQNNYEIDETYYNGIYVNYTDGSSIEGTGIDINYMLFNGEKLKSYSYSGAVENGRSIVYWVPGINIGLCIMVNSSTNSFPEAAVYAFFEYLQSGSSIKADAVYLEVQKKVYDILKKLECVPFTGKFKSKNADTTMIDGTYNNPLYGKITILNGKIRLGKLGFTSLFRKNNCLHFVLKNKLGITYMGSVKESCCGIEVLYNCTKGIYYKVLD